MSNSRRVATPRSAVHHGTKPRRSFSSDDRGSIHASLAPLSIDAHFLTTVPGPKTARRPSSSGDSGIHLDDDSATPPHSPTLSDEEENGSLQDELFSALTSTNQVNRNFFAKDQLPEILTEDRVRAELTRHFRTLSEDTIASHTRTICRGAGPQRDNSNPGGQSETKSYIKVLAILILVGKMRYILKLLEEEVNDSDLPLIKTSRPHDEKLFDLSVSGNQRKVVESFRKWNQLNVRNFEELQWTTLPVEFSRPEYGAVKHLKLQEQRILPFIKDSQNQKRPFSLRTELEGGSGSVSRVVIHPKHHNFHLSSDRHDPASYAVKRLHSQNEDAFKREVEILNKLSGEKHDHLISLLATYEQFGGFFLIFDWAQADLQAYWKTINPSPTFDRNTVTWMARQCKGIASGITKIHAHPTNYRENNSKRESDKKIVFGHHGDIKPENVLWFADASEGDPSKGGTLKLSDFGLAEFSVHQTTSMPHKSKWGVTLAYRAPEADLQQGKAIGRSYDIWTLGCLYLEFITWMLGGKELLECFSEVRRHPDAMWHDMETQTFFKLEIDSNTNKPIAVIKPAVKKVSSNSLEAKYPGPLLT
jgi:serine/threonine protein kinase